MASYTMQLREYIEGFSEDVMLSTRDKIEHGRTKLFDFNYPIFDSEYKAVFETHFIRNFYMREIGFETESLFKFQLETWLEINMPYYNQLFESELLEFDPFVNWSEDVTHDKTNDRDQKDSRDTSQTSNVAGENDSILDQTSDTGTTSKQDTTTKTTDDNFSREITSDTPASRLELTSNDGEGVIEYASNIEEDTENNVRDATSNVTGSSDSGTVDHATNKQTSNVDSAGSQNDNYNSNVNEFENFIQKRKGKLGNDSYSKMLQEYRNTFLRIEKDIFNDMQELFMLVY